MALNSPKIALFLPDLRAGGVERTMTHLANGLAGRGLQTEVVLVKAQGLFLKQLSPQVRVVDLRLPNTYATLPHLLRYLRTARPEAMISTLDLTNLMILIARRIGGIPPWLAIRVENSVSAQRRSPIKKKLEKLLLTWLYPWADEIITISHDLAKDFCQYTGIPASRVRVVYSSIITPELEARRSAALDHPWFQPGQPPVILAVGRLTYQKNFELLLEAFGQVRESRASRLLILGEGEERPALESLAVRLGIQADVSMPGLVENPYAYMARAAVLALSSRYEGLPTVLVEALACGCPVVSVNCASGPAEILAGGSYGHLVPVGDHELLGEAIEQSLAGDVRTPPASWLKQYALETVLDQYLQMMGLANRQPYHPEAGKP